MRQLRKLLFGETWALPLGVLLLLAGALLVRELAPVLWHDAGGLLLALGVLAVLGAAVRAPTR